MAQMRSGSQVVVAVSVILTVPSSVSPRRHPPVSVPVATRELKAHKSVNPFELADRSERRRQPLKVSRSFNEFMAQ